MGSNSSHPNWVWVYVGQVCSLADARESIGGDGAVGASASRFCVNDTRSSGAFRRSHTVLSSKSTDTAIRHFVVSFLCDHVLVGFAEHHFCNNSFVQPKNAMSTFEHLPHCFV